jgi:nucleoside-diphosphate-sugar epimerase
VNVTVFGATGAIGALTVDELLTHGHAVTAYARNPAKVPASWTDRVRVVFGELSDPAAVDTAVAGADLVVSALGPSLNRKATGLPLIEGTRNVLDSMKRHQVHRYIGLGTPSVRDPRERPTIQTRVIGFMGRTMLPRAYEELLGMSELVMNADPDWTIVRFTAPKDGSRKSRLRVGFYGTDKIGFAVTRADIAAFTAAQVDDHTYVDAAPAISN